MQPITATIDIKTEAIPLVEKWETDEGPRFVLTFEDADVSVTLTEQQIRGLVSRALAAPVSRALAAQPEDLDR